MTVRVAVPGDAIVGEGVCWDAAHERLIWVDIERRRVHVREGGRTRRFTAPDRVGVAVPTEASDTLLIAYGMQVGVLSLLDGTVSALGPPAADPRRVRLNDGGTDPAGRFWVGSAPIDEADRGAGALYRLTDHGTLEQVHDGLGLANGVTWNADGSRLYVADTLARVILSFAATDDGHLGAPSRLADVSALAGAPDGIAVDRDGDLWVAFWDGGAVHRFAPDGTLRDSVSLPVSRPTSCTFCGTELDRLLITSARWGLSNAQLTTQPLAGSILEISPGARGTTTVPARAPETAPGPRA